MHLYLLIYILIKLIIFGEIIFTIWLFIKRKTVCSECGFKLSIKDKVCTKCGCPTKENNKNTNYILVFTMLGLSFLLYFTEFVLVNAFILRLVISIFIIAFLFMAIITLKKEKQ